MHELTIVVSEKERISFFFEVEEFQKMINLIEELNKRSNEWLDYEITFLA